MKAVRNVPTGQLAMATAMNLRKEGNLEAAKLVEQVSSNPSKAGGINGAIKELAVNVAMPMSADKALSLYIDTHSSKAKYQEHRNAAKERNSNLYPPYRAVRQAMDKCIPVGVTITEQCAKVTLQGLLNHTAERLTHLQSEVIERLGEGCHELILHTKWGFDGASSQSNYKQHFSNNSISDDCILITSLVPIQLVLREKNSTHVWYNIKSSSPRLCRPIHLQFIKETSIKEKEDIEKQIKALKPTKIVLSESLSVIIHHRLLCTMIDGKVCSALTGKTKCDLNCLVY